jgi:hypothetical protein
MSYLRVIPRDLFNEADLLKCLGRLWINLEHLGKEHFLVHVDHTIEHFDIDQNETTGGIYVNNVQLTINDVEYFLERPLNSRQSYPLMITVNDEDFRVFNEDGSFTKKMFELIGGKLPLDKDVEGL